MYMGGSEKMSKTEISRENTLIYVIYISRERAWTLISIQDAGFLLRIP